MKELSCWWTRRIRWPVRQRPSGEVRGPSGGRCGGRISEWLHSVFWSLWYVLFPQISQLTSLVWRQDATDENTVFPIGTRLGPRCSILWRRFEPVRFQVLGGMAFPGHRTVIPFIGISTIHHRSLSLFYSPTRVDIPITHATATIVI